MNAWLEVAKQYGPFAALLLAFIFWQSRTITKLLDRHEKAYSGEIDRMSKHMDRLLDHVLGPQQASGEVPTMAQLKRAVTGEQRTRGEGTSDSGTREER